MREIKLWEIDQGHGEKPRITLLKSVNQTKTEENLEKILVEHPDLLFDGLKLVGRQTAAAGGALDLLGVDDNGRLIVFELKRGTLSRDAVAQVIDYSSHLAEMDPVELAEHISNRSGILGIEKIEDFGAWYQEHYQKSVYDIQKPAMVLVGLGADDSTRRMVSFLANNEIDMSLITFYGFEENGKTYLAKQVEVSTKRTGSTSSMSKGDILKLLKEKIILVGVEEFFDEIADFFTIELGAYKWPNQSGYSFSLPETKSDGRPTTLVYVSLYLNEKAPRKTEIRLQQRAIDAASDSFGEFCGSLSNKVTDKDPGGASVWVSSSSEWESMSDEFKKLCRGIVKGWKEKRESQTTADSQ